MRKEDYRKFKDSLKKILISCDEFEKGKEEFLKICEIYKKKYPNFIKNLESKVDKFLVFKRYPEDVQKFIYTTNACENINRQKIEGLYVEDIFNQNR